MTTHYHLSAVYALMTFALVVALFGTAHLLAISSDSRLARAWVGLGF